MNELSKSNAKALLTAEVATLHGRRVHLNENLTVPGPTEEIRRTWKERLFSLPWRPLQKIRYKQTRKPSSSIYAVGDHDIVMHPETYEVLKQQLGADFLDNDKPWEREGLGDAST